MHRHTGATDPAGIRNFNKDSDKLRKLIDFLDRNRNTPDKEIYAGLVAYCVKGEFHIDDWGPDAEPGYVQNLGLAGAG